MSADKAELVAAHGLDGLLEPASKPYDAMVSIAISLKRIADALTDQNAYTNPLAQAVLNGIALGAQDWIGHMARNGR